MFFAILQNIKEKWLPLSSSASSKRAAANRNTPRGTGLHQIALFLSVSNLEASETKVVCHPKIAL